MQRKVLYGLLLIVLLAVPVLGIYPLFVMKVLCFALFAAAFNLLIGYTGLLSFGHAMFLASAGYVTGYAIQTLGFSPELGVLAGTAAAALLGLIVGIFAIRRQGIYFAMVTLALAQMVYFVFLQAPFTHGEDGLQGVPRGKLFGVLDLSPDVTLVFRRARGDGAGLSADRAHRAFAVRPGAGGDQGKRAAGDLARLRYGSLQAARVHSVGGHRGSRRFAQGAGARLRDA